MSWRALLVVLAVASVGVVFGLDWQSAPPPQPVSTTGQQPIAFPALPPAPPLEPVVPDSADASKSSASASKPSREAAQARAQAPAVAAPAGCNVAACEARYKSFRASDCTYQPSDGPRKLCRRK